MKPISLFVVCIIIPFISHAQCNLSVSIGGGTEYIYASSYVGNSSKKSITIDEKITPAIEIRYRKSSRHFFNLGMSMYTENYKFKVTYMSEQKYGLGSGSSDNKSISEDNHYLFISPIIDMRFTKYFHFVVLPSYGYLISGSENSTITNRNSNSSGNVVIFDSSYNSTYAVNQQIFRIALGIEGYIPIYKNWWLILSQRYNLIQRGTISESLNFDIRNGKTIQPGFITAQVGILYHFNKKGKE